MKTNRSIWIVVAVGLFIFTLLAAPVAMAEDITEDSDTISIGPNEYWAHTISLPNGGGVEYEISGDRAMNVYFLDQENLNRYQAGLSFSYYEAGTSLDTMHAKMFFTIDETQGGTYYLVVESANYENLTFTYNLKYGQDVNTNPWDFFGYALSGTCCIISIVVFLLWIFVLVWVYKDAKRRGKSGALWVIVVLLLGLLGLLIWILVRPPLPGRTPPPPPQYPPPQ